MKKGLLLFVCTAMGIMMLTGCSHVYQALTDGKNTIINGLVDAKDEVLDAAANTIGDEPKEAILGALNVLNEAGGETALTSDTFLKGKRTKGTDDYTGTYSADYNKYSGTEVLFGGTTMERDGGNTIEVSCSLKVERGKAIIFLKSGSSDPAVLLETTDDYTGSIEVGNGSCYIGVWGDEFTGNIEINME